MPQYVIRGQKGTSKGVVVIEVETPEEAREAERKLKEEFPDYIFTTEPIVHTPGTEGL